MAFSLMRCGDDYIAVGWKNYLDHRGSDGFQRCLD